MTKVIDSLSAPGRSGARDSGFTLFELITALMVLGTVLALGVPIFIDLIRSNRAAANANELVSALSIARSEAVRRGARVTLCASDDGATCSGTWSDGWIVVADGAANDIAAPVVSDVLRAWSAPSGAPNVTTRRTNGNPVAATWVRFLPRGDVRTNGVVPLLFRIQPAMCSGEQGRDIELSAVGRTNVTRFSC